MAETVGIVASSVALAKFAKSCVDTINSLRREIRGAPERIIEILSEVEFLQVSVESLSDFLRSDPRMRLPRPLLNALDQEITGCERVLNDIRHLASQYDGGRWFDAGAWAVSGLPKAEELFKCLQIYRKALAIRLKCLTL